MTTDDLIRELMREIRADRAARVKSDEQLLTRLDRIESATGALSGDVRDLRKASFDNHDAMGKNLRRVADFVGMTDPRVKNGGA